MSLAKDFEYFCSQITPSDKELKNSKIKIQRIVKKLNQNYYETDSDSDHLYIVGSVGRNTAISNISDYDIIFELPHETYLKFNSYSNNGQSCLLQEVKKVIKETYPSTDIKGDGQVIVVQFTDYKIEVVPGFKENDDRFKYPDSNDGGHWKYTDPIPEKNASLQQIEATNNNYKRFANILRSWKNNVGFKFKGLLIDTLVYNYFEENPQKKFIGYDDYLLTLKFIFNYLQNQDENQSYWYALGSNQRITNDDNGLFIKKAKKAYSKIEELDENDDINQILQDLLGKDFPVHDMNLDKTKSTIYTEEFIEDKYKIDIRYNIKLDCDVEQNGFRTFKLRNINREKRWLRKNKTLHFYLDVSSIPQYVKDNIKVYWKVRNVGREAIKRNMIRGQINRGKRHIKEHTDFTGPHFVECYVVWNKVCIAKAHIDVPIDVVNGTV